MNNNQSIGIKPKIILTREELNTLTKHELKIVVDANEWTDLYSLLGNSKEILIDIISTKMNEYKQEVSLDSFKKQHYINQ